MPSTSSADRRLQWCFLGRLPYGAADELQRRVREAIERGESCETLLLLEHPHLYTLGRNADRGDLLVDLAGLQARGVEVFESDRGGRVTYHGPGQLVGYPVVDLDPDRRDIRRYVRDLQEVLVRTLDEFGVQAEPRHRAQEIGVWVGDRKIASIGVHIRRWITTHGFALNVSTDLSYFEDIVPCGLQGVRMTSVQALAGTAPELRKVARACARHLGEVFDRQLEEVAAGILTSRWPIAS